VEISDVNVELMDRVEKVNVLKGYAVERRAVNLEQRDVYVIKIRDVPRGPCVLMKSARIVRLHKKDAPVLKKSAERCWYVMKVPVERL